MEDFAEVVEDGGGLRGGFAVSDKHGKELRADYGGVEALAGGAGIFLKEGAGHFESLGIGEGAGLFGIDDGEDVGEVGQNLIEVGALFAGDFVHEDASGKFAQVFVAILEVFRVVHFFEFYVKFVFK